MQPWIGFSLLSRVAAISSVWMLVKERGAELQALTFLPMETSLQDVLALPILNHNSNARSTVIVKNTTPVSSRYP